MRSIAAVMLVVLVTSCTDSMRNKDFDGDRAYQFMVRQVEFGPRVPGTQSHADAADWISNTLTDANWIVETHEAEIMGHPIVNITAKRGVGEPWIIVGAHYDSRMTADQESVRQNAVKPVPGANDGASGAAVLLELANVFPEKFNGQLWLVFFDAEDNGNIDGWDWILGSKVFVDKLNDTPDKVVIVDMVGDADLNIYLEHNSDIAISTEIWSVADELGYGSFFIPTEKYQMLDDHLPFVNAGIPTVLIIDFDYPYWHTLQDTPDKISGSSLETVGRTLQQWLYIQFSITSP